MSTSYDYTYPLCRHRGRRIWLAVDLSEDVVPAPGPSTTDYAVWLFYWAPSPGAPDATHRHLVRIDDREHGGPHVDRFYSEEGGKDTSLSPEFDVVDAEAYLRKRWRHFAETYYQARGGWR